MKCLEKKRRYRYYYFVTTCKDLELKDIVIKVNHWECGILKFINNLRKKYDNTTWFGSNVQDFEEAEMLDNALYVFNLNDKYYFVTDIIELKYDTITNRISSYDRVFLPIKDDIKLKYDTITNRIEKG